MNKFKLFLFLLSLTVLIAIPADAAVKCTFSRDLELGMQGEDIRCLQKYLNDAGYTISTSGVGSPGNETSLLRDLTKKAIIAWQKANGISPASGYFGPKSRAKYNQLVGAVASAGNSSPSSGLEQTLAEAMSLLNELESKSPSTSTTVSGSEKSAKDMILKAINAIKEAEDEIDDADDTDQAEIELEDAKEDLFDAVYYFFKGDFTKSLEYADDAYDNAEDAYEEVGGETDEDEADNAIDNAEDQIEYIQDQIDEADDDGEDVDEAEDLLADAEDKLDEAKEAYDDEDYKEAISLAEDAEDLADDALDAIGSEDEERAQNAIDDAEDAIADAKDMFEEAEDNDDYTGDAEDLIEEAEDLLEEAEDAYDDEDYDEAIDLAEEAEDLADEAMDEIE